MPTCLREALAHSVLCGMFPFLTAKRCRAGTLLLCAQAQQEPVHNCVIAKGWAVPACLGNGTALLSSNNGLFWVDHSTSTCVWVCMAEWGCKPLRASAEQAMQRTNNPAQSRCCPGPLDAATASFVDCNHLWQPCVCGECVLSWCVCLRVCTGCWSGGLLEQVVTLQHRTRASGELTHEYSRLVYIDALSNGVRFPAGAHTVSLWGEGRHAAGRVVRGQTSAFCCRLCFACCYSKRRVWV